MDAHPLRGPARWLILPGVSAGAGALAGLGSLGLIGSVGRDAPLAAAFLGLATGLAVAVTPKTWAAVLLAPPFAFLGMTVSAIVYFYPSEPFQALRVALSFPALHLLSLISTAPMVVLHGRRMRRKASRGLGWILAAGLGVAAGLTINEALNTTRAVAFVVLCAGLNLGGAAAMELALRVSRRPAG